MEPIYLPDLRLGGGIGGTDESIMEDAIRPLALKFQVSASAMRIRAESMGFLLRKREAMLFG